MGVGAYDANSTAFTREIRCPPSLPHPTTYLLCQVCEHPLLCLAVGPCCKQLHHRGSQLPLVKGSVLLQAVQVQILLTQLGLLRLLLNNLCVCVHEEGAREYATGNAVNG